MENQLPIEHKLVPATLVVMRRIVARNRDDIRAALDGIRAEIPAAQIAGPAFGIFWFVTSVTEGFDVQVGFPVWSEFAAAGLQSQPQPALEVLSYLHQGPVTDLQASYRQLYAYAGERALISDEFRREVYLDQDDPAGATLELQFMVHNWNRLLAQNLQQGLGPQVTETVMQGSQDLGLEASPAERFAWTKAAMQRLEGLAGDRQCYQTVSGCAHVFPPAQVDKLRQVYQAEYAQHGDALQAVDAVIAFMDTDPGWGERPRRQGYTIYAQKNPRDRQAYQSATNDLERRRAYCFCPLLSDRLDQGMPRSFCYCGSGWYRQQWEGATGQPVQIEILQTVAQGDLVCEFAVHLSEER